MRRIAVVCVFVALALSLVAGARPAIVGDGGEYVAQAVNFAAGRGPAIDPREVPRIVDTLASIEPRWASWTIDRPTRRARLGGRDFLHFWFYALLVAPILWCVMLAGGPATWAFALVNIALLAAVVWVLLPRIGLASTTLLVVSPIIWWIDKAHTEVFSFALIAIALALMRAAPWWAVLAAGAASTQNPPIAALIPLVALVGVVDDPSRVKDRRFLAGLLGAGILASLHPVYTYVQHGQLSLLLSATRDGVPTWSEFSAVVLDTNMGLVASHPLLLIVVAAAVTTLAFHNRRALVTLDMAVASLACVLFLFSFGQALNQHSGGTPGLSRYALWLVPLAVPLLAACHALGGRRWARLVAGAATVSAIASTVTFHPSVQEWSREPTWLASLLWHRFPALDNPLPEVFMEVNLRSERPWAPVVAGGCAKILVAGRGNDDSVWPVPCYPAVLPSDCHSAGAICYANLGDEGYAFVKAPGRGPRVAPLRREWVWPSSSAPGVRRIYDEWGWTMMRQSGEPPLIRQTRRLRTSVLTGAGRHLIVLRDIGPDAFLEVRSADGLAVVLMDPQSPEPLGTTFVDADAGLVRIDVPQAPVLVLGLRPAGP